MNRWLRLIVPAVGCAGMVVAGCASGQAPGAGNARGTPSPPSTGSRGKPTSASGCPVIVRGFSCQMQERIAAARSYVATAPGEIGLVLRDRVTGATWRNANASRAFPAASTVKLAMVADLMLREDAGEIRLTQADLALIDAALRESSDEAADQLWFAYENAGFSDRVRRFGMTGCAFTGSEPHWGSMFCAADDLSNLMDYVLNRLPSDRRAEIMTDLRHVAPIQEWGVWGAGPGNQPGNKNGWVSSGGIWTVSTVGFAGPGARYTLAVMNHLGKEAGFRAGADTLTQIAAILFQGHHVPAPDVSATS